MANFKKEAFITGNVVLANDTLEGVLVKKDGTVATASAVAYGVTAESGKAGTNVTVLRQGFYKANTTAAAIAEGDKIAGAAGGAVVKVGGSAGATVESIGRAESAVTASGGVISAYFNFVNPNTVKV